ncbi:MFS transporter [Micrococcus lylae]|uniref:MFS transporter n=2 Tax=Micrococcus lylae TaxID=1273 RepID=A0ABY2K1B1_9MICC|nr:MFS transporter [Micrococcus lylae]TFH98204.1 MFS transporter [Micrococcus lylae]WIK82529.1 MFS transporter [Micrococcus lylae]
MDFTAYRRLLLDPRIRSLLAVGFVARFPNTAAGVVLTLHVATTLGLGYGMAGIATAVMTLGIAIGSPWRGRVLDRRGVRRTLLPSVIAVAVLWPVVPHLPYALMLVGVFLAGLLALPIFSIVRQGLGVMTRGRDRQTAFSLDSIITETVFMVGPALGAVVATLGSTALGLTVIGLSAAAGGIVLMVSDPPTRSSQLTGPSVPGAYTAAEDQERAVEQAGQGGPVNPGAGAAELMTGALPVVTGALPAVTGSLPVVSADTQDQAAVRAPRQRRRLTAGQRMALLRGQFSWLTGRVAAVYAVAMAAGILLVGTEVSAIAELEQTGQEGAVGIVLAFWCGASAVGGLLYGAMARAVSPLVLMALFSVSTLPMALVDGLWVLAAVSVLSGLFTAPTLASASSTVSLLVAEERRGEAMGFYGSAMTAGSAMGAPLAGVFIDSVSPEAGYVFAVAVSLLLVGVAALLGARGRRRA